MSRADADALGRHEQDAIGDTEKSAALSDELRQAGVTARLAVDFFVDFVNQLQFSFDVFAVLERLPQFVIDTQAFADNGYRRRKQVREQARVEPGRLAGVLRKHGNQESEYGPVVEQDGQHEQGAARLQRAPDELGLGVIADQDVSVQFGNELVDFVVIGAVAAPDTVPVDAVEAETLCPGHQRLQQVRGLADVSFCREAVYVRCHGRSRYDLGRPQCHRWPLAAVIQVSGETIFLCRFSRLRGFWPFICTKDQFGAAAACRGPLPGGRRRGFGESEGGQPGVVGTLFNALEKRR